jgi:hypothetical protein
VHNRVAKDGTPTLDLGFELPVLKPFHQRDDRHSRAAAPTIALKAMNDR